MSAKGGSKGIDRWCEGRKRKCEKKKCELIEKLFFPYFKLIAQRKSKYVVIESNAEEIMKISLNFELNDNTTNEN